MFEVGFTTGVFDIFHVGHLNILKRSKQLCKYLVVGVNSDRLCLEYKDKVPVVPLKERIQILEAIRYVDEVIVCETRDKVDAWNKIHYDVLFQGGDWRKSPLYDETFRFLESKGAEIVLFPYTDTTSSTLLRQALNERIA